MTYSAVDNVTNFRQTLARLSITTTLAQYRAGIFLARHGQRFLVDFGTDNAPEKAQSLRASLKAQTLRRGDKLHKRSLAGQSGKSKTAKKRRKA